MPKSFCELVVWQRARELAGLLYRLTRQFPHEEIYGLTAQLRRAGVSIASHIAEGSGRGTRSDYRGFLRIARGSALRCKRSCSSRGTSDLEMQIRSPTQSNLRTRSAGCFGQSHNGCNQQPVPCNLQPVTRSSRAGTRPPSARLESRRYAPPPASPA
ncbi:MAG TPA: four helix bundle protein [Acidobacteriaceae bacterium]|nr:four helix bundle protein [Acidobacteriaceae bacterium]